MAESAEEHLQTEKEKFDELVKQFFNPAQFPLVEWPQVEHARRMVVSAAKHAKKEQVNRG